MIPKLQAAAACFLCSPPNFNSSKFNPMLKDHKNIFTYYAFHHSPLNQNCMTPAPSSC
jgi:hypothetical protein